MNLALELEEVNLLLPACGGEKSEKKTRPRQAAILIRGNPHLKFSNGSHCHYPTRVLKTSTSFSTIIIITYSTSTHPLRAIYFSLLCFLLEEAVEYKICDLCEWCSAFLFTRVTHRDTERKKLQISDPCRS